MQQKQNNDNTKDPLQQSVDDIRKLQNKFNEEVEKAAENSEDVKEGRTTKEEEMKDPGYTLFNEISETSIKILQDEEIIKTFKEVSSLITKLCTVGLPPLPGPECGYNTEGYDKIADEILQKLINVIAVSMTQSAYLSVIFYDELLKKELTKMDEGYAHHINLCKSDIEAHNTVLTIFRKKIDDLEKTLKVSELKDQNNTE